MQFSLGTQLIYPTNPAWNYLFDSGTSRVNFVRGVSTQKLDGSSIQIKYLSRSSERGDEIAEPGDDLDFSAFSAAVASMPVLSPIWDSPEEDEAWKDL